MGADRPGFEYFLFSLIASWVTLGKLLKLPECKTQLIIICFKDLLKITCESNLMCFFFF